jgi:SAM-dependent methyltransferase
MAVSVDRLDSMPRNEERAPAPAVTSATSLARRDRAIATLFALRSIDTCIRLIRSDGEPSLPMVDLGCSTGALSHYIANQLGITEVVGIDRNEKPLSVAARRGLKTIEADLETDLPLPLEARSASVVTSFGALEHITWCDEVLLEARRLLVDGGWLLVSVPNLGSYVNRLALLLGYQPRDVEVSRSGTPGILPTYRERLERRPLGHVHTMTLRCMRELLEQTGFDVVRVYGFSPFSSGLKSIPDWFFGRIPSLSRRFLVLAQVREMGLRSVAEPRGS